jgi:guanosine-3',5'-bis(diphosphate) 3'-pyrophosphohydrolase
MAGTSIPDRCINNTRAGRRKVGVMDNSTAAAYNPLNDSDRPAIKVVSGQYQHAMEQPPLDPAIFAEHAILSDPIIDEIAERLRGRDIPDANTATVHRLYVAAYQSPTLSALIARLLEYLSDVPIDLVRRSYALASIAHAGIYRQSGEPYIDHPVAVATILLDLRLDSESIAAALLHDVVEDTGVGLDLIQSQFGDTVAHLVDGVTKLSGLEKKSKEDRQAGSYRKMFIASADDPRVILIKLADRLHNMRTLDATPPDKQRRIGRETLDIYAPLAHRLGMWQIKSDLEDLSFKALYPEQYHEIAQQLKLRKDARERVIQRVTKKLREALEREGIHAQVTGRPKHIYSIWRKMDRKGLPLERIYDQLAVRVIVQERDRDRAVGLCYRVLGIVHNVWTPVLSEFDDYIAVPKESSYQSLHTTVIIPGGSYCEIQIRSEQMHEVAEHGIAAHWRYKEGSRRSADQNYETKIKWLRELISWRHDMTDAQFIDSLKPELDEQVYVFTPKGKIIDLPVNSTPVDFAYRIHSEVGNHCVGAKVNGRIVGLDYHLQNGEIVEVMTAKSNRGPSRDWLNFVKTPSARSHIKRFFRRSERDENIAGGRDMLEKEMKRLGLQVGFEYLAEVGGLRSVEELFSQIGSGDISARTVAQKALAQQVEEQPILEPPPEPAPVQRPDQQVGGVQIMGLGSVHSRLARCCNPVVGEPIVGYVTRGRGVTVHRADCRTILHEQDKERLIDVSWGGQQPKGFSVPLRIESWDRVGLWRDVSNVIADAGVNIEHLSQGTSRYAGRAVLQINITVQSIQQLSSLLDRLNRITDVIDARRESQAH